MGEYARVYICFSLLSILSWVDNCAGATRKNGGHKPPFTNDPVVLKPMYHEPNQYEGESFNFWYGNKPMPHQHGNLHGPTERHQHFPSYNENEEHLFSNFITDPPGTGLSAHRENRDSSQPVSGSSSSRNAPDSDANSRPVDFSSASQTKSQTNTPSQPNSANTQHDAKARVPGPGSRRGSKEESSSGGNVYDTGGGNSLEVPVNRNKNSAAFNDVGSATYGGAKKVVPKNALRPATYLLDNYPSSHALSFKSAIGLAKPPYQAQPYNHNQSTQPCGPHLPSGHIFGPQHNRASHLPCCPCCSGAPTPCSLPSCQPSVATYQVVRPPPPCCMQLPICCLRLRKFHPVFAISKP